MTTLTQPIYTSVNLSGKWKFRLDPDDAGLSQAWFREAFEEAELRLPGSTNENGIGATEQLEPGLNKESVRSLRQRYRYVGAVWYQKEIRIPDHWAGKAVRLFLERVMLESRVWINGQEAGMQDSLSVPHVFELAPGLQPGQSHLLTIRVDNRDCRHLGTHPSAFTDETQTIWNGIIGRMELQAFDKIRLQDIQVIPDATGRKLTVKVAVRNETTQLSGGALSLAVRFTGEDAARSARAFPRLAYETELTGAERQLIELTYDMGEDCLLWDEFDPALYDLTVSLEAPTASGIMRDCRTFGFGMRTFAREGTQFTVNGRPTFLRGTLDCCIFPMTGYPPMELPAWERIFRIVKSYGLNHVRFHSWCPPEAAFLAADQIGIYLQVEGPVWMDTWNVPVGSHPEHYRYLPDEARRIIDAYGNHPSFCLFSNGNELNGDIKLLHEIIDSLKAQDEGHRQLYTLTANWDRELDSADDFFIAQTIDGIGVRGQYFPDQLTDTTMLSYEEAVAKRPVPIISHEVGQYTVYPDVDDIPKYAGCLRPTNLEAIRDDLAEKGLLQDVRKFVEGSGKLAVQLYRVEIEAAMRTPGMGGFQLLDLHDFPGQSTATVGILDAFWETKGLIEPELFRQFCGPTVLLLDMPKRIYTQAEHWHAELKVSHYGKLSLSDVEVEWSIRKTNGETLDGGVLRCGNVPLGGGALLGSVSSDALGQTAGAEKLNVTARIAGTDIAGDWEIWVYPSVEAKYTDFHDHASENVAVAQTLDAQALEQLERGGSVLLLPYDSNRHSDNPGKFFPVFWSPVHFSSENPCGIYVQHEHPAFGRFPTGNYAEYPWKDLLEHSHSMHLSGDFAAIEPLVQVIPNFYHNKKLANLIECKVGKGKLIICSIDLVQRLEERPAARQLRASLLAYMESEHFRPETEVRADQLLSWLQGSPIEVDSARKLNGKDLAIGRTAIASSEMNPGYAAGKGNDGIGHTVWRAADREPGHWWQVDLGEIREIAGTRVKFTHEANYLYVIQVSDDGENWRVAVNQTGQTNEEQVRVVAFSDRARYVKIIYNGLAPGVSAGHYSFEVYGN